MNIQGAYASKIDRQAIAKRVELTHIRGITINFNESRCYSTTDFFNNQLFNGYRLQPCSVAVAMQAQCGDQTTAMLCSSSSKALTHVSAMQAMLYSNVAYDSHGHRMFLPQFRPQIVLRRLSTHLRSSLPFIRTISIAVSMR